MATIKFNQSILKYMKSLSLSNAKNMDLEFNPVFKNLEYNERYLGEENDGKHKSDGMLSGEEFLNFASHIDTNGNSEITEEEIDAWRDANVAVGNKGHANFTNEQVEEVFRIVEEEASNEFVYDPNSPLTAVEQRYNWRMGIS